MIRGALRLLLPVTCVLASAVFADSDRWYVIEIAGMPCGWYHEHVEHDEDIVRSMNEERLVIARGDQRVETGQRIVFEESPDGEPLRAEVIIESGGEPTRLVYTFDGSDSVSMERSRHGRVVTETLPLDGTDWFTPEEVRRFVTARIEAGARTIEYRTVEPGNGMQVVTVRSERIGTARFDHRGRSLEVSRWRTRTSGLPIELVELRSTDGILVESEAPLGIGPMRMELADREQAFAALEQPAPELLHAMVIPVAGLVRSDRLQRARYVVRADGLPSFSLPDSGAQRARLVETGVVEIEVDAARGSKATEAERSDPAYLASSGAIDFGDEAVTAFVARGLEGCSRDPLVRAATLRRAVARHMRHRHYGTAFASASDAARTGSGDCTEHAVLLAAALRADGIPARVASGLVHGRVDEATEPGFAWHMWTQALIGGQWIDLDATRPLDFDAGHLLVSTSALAQQGGEDELAALLPLFGRLDIERLDLETDRPGGDDS